MKIHVLTLFPEMITNGFAESIIGRAARKDIISLHAVNIRDYTLDKHKKVDDYPYGGGAGMLMQAQPVFDAWKDVTKGKKLRTIYVTPQGVPFTQSKAEELAGEEELVFLCGHYEGIDERVLEETVTDYISIGDYILTGGELPAMVIIDTVARLIPGVLGNDSSAEEESFYNDLLEYPQYSRPEVWHNKRVPAVLLSGDHRKIAQWRLKQSVQKTAEVRPDLYAKYDRKQQLIKQLLKDKRNNIHMIESLSRGLGEILFEQGEDVLIYDRKSSVCMLNAADREAAEKLAALAPAETKQFVTSVQTVKDYLEEQGFSLCFETGCAQFVYTQRVPLSVQHKDIRKLTSADTDYVCRHCEHDSEEYVRERIKSGALYGAFVEEKLVGFIGIHSEGGMGMLYVDEACRRQGIAASLEAWLVNHTLERGQIPYGQVELENKNSIKLQEKLGFYRAGKLIWRLGRITSNDTM